jgi:hypothetical protein
MCRSPQKTAAVEMTQQPSSRVAPHENAENTPGPHLLPRGAYQVADDIQRELELQHQRQQQEVVSAAMQAMGALPPNAVFKVCSSLPLFCFTRHK